MRRHRWGGGGGRGRELLTRNQTEGGRNCRSGMRAGAKRELHLSPELCMYVNYVSRRDVKDVNYGRFKEIKAR